MIAASYSRYSSDMQDESSIVQQQRECRKKAELNGHTIKPDLEFSDSAVSGTKLDRDGLTAMLAAAAAGMFGTLYFDSLSRLAREFVITLPTLKQLVYVDSVRFVSVSEGIDSNVQGWELNAIFSAWQHGEYIKTLRAAVLRGQEYAVRNGHSVGDWCLGYSSEPIPGSETARRGRHPKPRMQVVVFEPHAEWVRRTFHWFVIERRSITWIARELTRLNVPKDHRAKSARWHHAIVRRILRNSKYIGLWVWGRRTNRRNPLTGQVWQEDRPIEAVAKFTRDLPHLRIIEDELFCRAQGLLDENEAKYKSKRTDDGCLRGSVPGDGTPRHLLQGLLYCSGCDTVFHTGGPNAKYLVCSNSKNGGDCTCRTQVPRQRAEEEILNRIGEEILRDPAWTDAVFGQALSAWLEAKNRCPDELASLRRQKADLEGKICRLVDRLENGDAAPEISQRLAERRQQLAEINRKIRTLEIQDNQVGTEPTKEWVVEQLRELGEVLDDRSPAASKALRDLVGGRIIVHQVIPPGHKRGHVKLVFTIRTNRVVRSIAGHLIGSAIDELAETETTIEIDLQRPAKAESFVDEAMELFEGAEVLEVDEIADRLGIHRNQVRKALEIGHERNGKAMPDLAKRRGQIMRARNAKARKEHDEDILRLYRADELLDEIAKAVGLGRDTVRKRLISLCAAEGEVYVDGRARRKTLDQKVRKSARSGYDKRSLKKSGAPWSIGAEDTPVETDGANPADAA